MGGKASSFLILFAAMLWGTTGTTQALAPETAHPISIGAVRLAVGGLFLLILVLVTGKLSLRDWPIKAIVGASFCMALYQPLFFSAVSSTGVAIGTVVAIGSAPILSGLIEWAYLNTRPTRIWWFSTGISIIGCLLLFADKESVSADPVGILLALGAGLSFASYTLISRGIAGDHSSLSLVAIVFTLSAIFLSPFLLIYDLSWIRSVRGVVASLQLGIVATGAAYLLFAKGLSNVSPSTAVTFALAEPMTAALLGFLVLEESLNITAWTGIFLLVIGIGILIWSPKNEKMTA
ncbi:EamA family transporter [Aciduricibacillus chroicocephali]|uniref:EamA family transporter n=1 Tax=Aciduricibacillus chroicocephali TaxID=3054939 RepID=A0ABY9KUP1_9BACI|nr:EamA family transporter [Bacillaceae bacterium 44XB]